ncbi:MAG: TIGR04283 family arsenosugar biosynthesis glycosyltransferase [Pseudomonadota bacterium]
MSLSVIIPTLNAQARLPACLKILVPGAIDGLIREVIVSDAGSTDATLAIAEELGATLVQGARGRGAQMRAAAVQARGTWLLFLHGDTCLGPGWMSDIRRHLASRQAGGAHRVGVFSLAFDEEGIAPSLVAGGAMVRTRLFKAPYGDQGLLIHREDYDAIGGFASLPLFEDVDIIDRLRRRFGRQTISIMPARAVTSAARYRADGYARRVLRNFVCLSLYRLGFAPKKIKKIYDGDAGGNSVQRRTPATTKLAPPAGQGDAAPTSQSRGKP